MCTVSWKHLYSRQLQVRAAFFKPGNNLERTPTSFLQIVFNLHGANLIFIHNCHVIRFFWIDHSGRSRISLHFGTLWPGLHCYLAKFPSFTSFLKGCRRLFPPWWRRGPWWMETLFCSTSCSILKICWGLCYLGYHRERCSWLLGGPDWMDGRGESHWGRTKSWCMKYIEIWEVQCCQVASCIQVYIIT